LAVVEGLLLYRFGQQLVLMDFWMARCTFHDSHGP
jgi:hypothetical protein